MDALPDHIMYDWNLQGKGLRTYNTWQITIAYITTDM